MSDLARYWSHECGVDARLEADSTVHRWLNRHLVAALMNRFPNAATRVFMKSRGELARLLFVEREGGSFRVLRAMYEFDDPRRRGDLINRLLMQSPAIKAARNRRRIAQKLLELRFQALPAGSPALVLAIGAGDGSLEAEVIARSGRQDIYYCGVDKDERAFDENAKVLREHGLSDRGMTVPGNIAGASDLNSLVDQAARHFGARFDGISVTVCQGITEYLDIGVEGNPMLAALLKAIHACTRAEGSLILGQTDRHDRVPYLERGLSWYMRLRDREELASEIEQAGWRLALCEHEPMKLITMCLAMKTEASTWRLDRQSPPRGFRHLRPAASPARKVPSFGRRN